MRMDLQRLNELFTWGLKNYSLSPFLFIEICSFNGIYCGKRREKGKRLLMFDYLIKFGIEFIDFLLLFPSFSLFTSLCMALTQHILHDINENIFLFPMYTQLPNQWSIKSVKKSKKYRKWNKFSISEFSSNFSYFFSALQAAHDVNSFLNVLYLILQFPFHQFVSLWVDYVARK